MDDIDTLIQYRAATLPEELREAVLSPKTEVLIKRLAQRYGLSPDESTAFEKEVVLVLLGLEPREGFGEALANAVNLEAEAVEYINGELSKELFSPLSPILDVLATTEETDEGGEISPPPTEEPDSGGNESAGAEERRETPEAAGAGSTLANPSKDVSPAPAIQSDGFAGAPSLEEVRLTGPSSLPSEHREVPLPSREPYRPSGGGDPYREPIEPI